jgi:hypothetical protein
MEFDWKRKKAAAKRRSMRKTKTDELREEYARDDLGPGVRGKFLESYRSGTNLVLLSPDVAKAFPSEEAVNAALRLLIKIAEKTVTHGNDAGGHTAERS